MSDVSVFRLVSAPFLSVFALVCALPMSVSAQGVYRIVGPDGKVTYSDQPPASANSRPGAKGTVVSSGSPAQSGLPPALQQAMSRFPVTLYTGKECAPCDSGRNYLRTRGVPFAEKTVQSNEDVEALKRLSGAGSLPLLTVGGQHIKGFSDAEWGPYLDAAGYPKQSVLLPGYRAPAATPLVATKPAASDTEQQNKPSKATTPPAAPEDIPVTPPITNPSGIRF